MAQIRKFILDTSRFTPSQCDRKCIKPVNVKCSAFGFLLVLDYARPYVDMWVGVCWQVLCDEAIILLGAPQELRDARHSLMS